MNILTYHSELTEILGVGWNETVDSFLPVIISLPVRETLTKRALDADPVRLLNMFGFRSPAIKKQVIALTTLGKQDGTGEPVDSRYYYPMSMKLVQKRLQAFCDVSEQAYARVL